MAKKIDPGEKAVAELDALGESHAALTQSIHDHAVAHGAVCKPSMDVASKYPSKLHNSRTQSVHDRMRSNGAKCFAQPKGVLTQFSQGDISDERRAELLGHTNTGQAAKRIREGEL